MLHDRASRPRLLLVPLLALAALAALAAGCGSDSDDEGLLSREQAGELRGTLTRVEEDVAAEDCTSAAQQAASLEEQIDSLRGVGTELRSALRSSARRLETLVSESCQAVETPPVETTPETPDEGTTDVTEEDDEEAPDDEEKAPKEKGPKDEAGPPGREGKGSPGPPDAGGGAGLPGESDSGEDGD